MLARIRKDKTKIPDGVKLRRFTEVRLRMQTTQHKEMEYVLLLWFKHVRIPNFPISGPILEEKTRETASPMGIDSFHFSDGWLSRIKKRPNLVFK